MPWETVIGLEVHVQLATRTKLFCGCATEFGAPPNSLVCPVCLGLPGALPVPNEEAIRLATIAALGLACQVHPVSVFARKNYFYPDLPKGYQISQFDRPLATGGRVVCQSPERGPIEIGITRLHVEEDAGKLLHDRFRDGTAIDLNRAGTPLAEIVSEPDLRSAGEARAFLNAVKQILLYAGVSDCSMEQGSLRVDANVSIRSPGSSVFGTKTEIKNMNSFANTERAIEAERLRQQRILEAGGSVEQVTLLYDAEAGEVRPMRSKEESHDYRYFPDPDLPPIVLADAWIDARRAEVPELPEAARVRLMRTAGLSEYDATVLTAERAVSQYYQAVVSAGADPKAAANWVMGDVLAGYNASGRFTVAPERLAALLTLVAQGGVSLQAARRILEVMATDASSPEALARQLGLVQVRDEGQLETWLDAVMAAHPEEVSRWRSGETKLVGFLVGQVMKHSNGQADPKAISALLMRKRS